MKWERILVETGAYLVNFKPTWLKAVHERARKIIDSLGTFKGCVHFCYQLFRHKWRYVEKFPEEKNLLFSKLCTD